MRDTAARQVNGRSSSPRRGMSMWRLCPGWAAAVAAGALCVALVGCSSGPGTSVVAATASAAAASASAPADPSAGATPATTTTRDPVDVDPVDVSPDLDKHIMSTEELTEYLDADDPVVMAWYSDDIAVLNWYHLSKDGAEAGRRLYTMLLDYDLRHDGSLAREWGAMIGVDNMLLGPGIGQQLPQEIQAVADTPELHRIFASFAGSQLVDARDAVAVNAPIVGFTDDLAPEERLDGSADLIAAFHQIPEKWDASDGDRESTAWVVGLALAGEGKIDTVSSVEDILALIEKG